MNRENLMYPIITLSRYFSTVLLIFTVSVLITFSTATYSNAAQTLPHIQLVKVADSQSSTSDNNGTLSPGNQQIFSSENGPSPVLSPNTQGPGSFISSLIHSLSRKADSSDSGVKELVTGMPDLLPDLYKVFLTL